MQQRQVRDLMRIRHGHIVSESATLREVAERLIISDCDVMAVTDASGCLSGIVCESSIVRALMSNSVESSTIQSIVSRYAESVRIDACLSAVLPLFRSSATTAIPVVDLAGKVCGLLMRRDVLGSLLNRRLDTPESESSASKAASSASMIRPPATKSTPVVKPVADDATTASHSAAPKPHFMRAEEARRILWAAEDRL